jgi:hypothetical protein
MSPRPLLTWGGGDSIVHESVGALSHEWPKHNGAGEKPSRYHRFATIPHETCLRGERWRYLSRRAHMVDNLGSLLWAAFAVLMACLYIAFIPLLARYRYRRARRPQPSKWTYILFGIGHELWAGALLLLCLAALAAQVRDRCEIRSDDAICPYALHLNTGVAVPGGVILLLLGTPLVTYSSVALSEANPQHP